MSGTREAPPLHLHLPPLDFPYTRRAGARGRTAALPLLLTLAAVGVAVGWDPVFQRLAVGQALGGSHHAAIAARRARLVEASAALLTVVDAHAALPVAGRGAPPEAETRRAREAWRSEARALGARFDLHGDPQHPSLGALEVRMRAAWLLVASVPDGPDADRLLAHARAELTRITEDLADVHAP